MTCSCFERRQRAGEIDVREVEDVVVLQRQLDAELEQRVDDRLGRHAFPGAVEGSLEDGNVELGGAFTVGEARFLPGRSQPLHPLRQRLGAPVERQARLPWPQVEVAHGIGDDERPGRRLAHFTPRMRSNTPKILRTRRNGNVSTFQVKGEHVPGVDADVVDEDADVRGLDAGIEDLLAGAGGLVGGDSADREALRAIELLAVDEVLGIERHGALEGRHRLALVHVGGMREAKNVEGTRAVGVQRRRLAQSRNGPLRDRRSGA